MRSSYKQKTYGWLSAHGAEPEVATVPDNEATTGPYAEVASGHEAVPGPSRQNVTVEDVFNISIAPPDNDDLVELDPVVEKR